MVEVKPPAHIIDICGGALVEEIDVQMGRVVENLLDPNTDWKKKRTLTIKLEFSTDKSREITKCEAYVDPKLAASLPVETRMAFGKVDGRMAAQEITNHPAGQMALDGSEVMAPPVIVIGGKPKAETKNQEVEEHVHA